MNKILRLVTEGSAWGALTPLLLLSLFSNSAMASLTEVVPTDKSFEYLRILLGDIVNVITGGTGPAAPDHILGAMSNVLNSGMLIFTGLISGYVFLTGVLNSAHEGTALGKAYNTMWIPMRMVLALSLVLPFAGGYSAMQVGVIWMGGKGIGLANSTWNASLDFLNANGSLYPPPINSNFDKLGDAYLQSRVCMHGLNAADRYTNITDNPIVKKFGGDTPIAPVSGEDAQLQKTGRLLIGQVFGNSNDVASVVIDRTAAILTGYSTGVPRFYGPKYCGRIMLEFPALGSDTDLEDPIKKFRADIHKASANLDVSMDGIAKDIIAHAIDSTLPIPDKSAFQTNVLAYKTAHKAALKSAMAAIAQARLDKFVGGNPKIASSGLGAREAGWLSAGAWYWDIQRINAETQELTKVKPEITNPNPEINDNEDYDIFSNGLTRYIESRNFVNSFGENTTALKSSAYDEGDKDNDGVLYLIKAAIGSAMYAPDPITGLQNAGHVIISVIEGALVIAMVPATAAAAADEAVASWGSALAMAPRAVTYALRMVTEHAVQFIVGVSFLLIPLALLLAFYLPATPLILWILGVAGWFILLIEAVIAAPIWAASHAMPEGEGWVGQRAMAGYMVLLSLFLRPTLMLFGFFASMVLMIVMGKTTLLLFIPFITSLNSGYVTGAVTLFASLGILVMLLVQLSHRCYGLIHEVPDKVLRYIGGGAENLGESSGEQSNKGSFTSGAAQASKATSEAVKGKIKKNQDKKQGIDDKLAR